MEHIFNFSKVGNNNLYSPDDFTSEQAKEAFYKGKWTVKFHGSNGFITKENNQNGKEEICKIKISQMLKKNI